MTKTKNERITTLENEVAELKLIVHELRGKKSIEPSTTNTVEDIIEFEGQQYRKVDRVARKGDVVMFTVNNIHYQSNKSYKVIRNVTFTDDNGKVISVYNNYNRIPENVAVYELIEAKPLTSNQKRAEIIEKAKKFIEKVSSRQSCWTVNEMGNETYRQRCTVNEFIINNEKRTVVVLVKGEDSGKIFEKGITKCNPSDVFNEHIGKAIALGRALGLDVSEFEQAVQPTKAVLGTVVGHRSKEGIFRTVAPNFVLGKTCTLGSDTAKYGKIINDTNAKYEEG